MGASILSLADFRGGPTVLSAQRGAEREAALRALRGAAEGQGVFARYVACDFDRGLGPASTNCCASACRPWRAAPATSWRATITSWA